MVGQEMINKRGLVEETALLNREELRIEEWMADLIGTGQSNGDVSDSLCDLQAGNIYN